MPIPTKYPVVGRDAFRTATGVHAAAIAKAARKGDREAVDAVYSGVPASLVGREQQIEVGPMSGKWNVIFWLERHGLTASDDLVDRILARGKRSATTLTAEEILEAIACRAGGVAGPWLQPPGSRLLAASDSSGQGARSPTSPGAGARSLEPTYRPRSRPRSAAAPPSSTSPTVCRLRALTLSRVSSAVCQAG